jgi:pimeloyl-ACP methyl ester carboxylesterase
MHGVFGSSDNWQSVGKQLAESFKVYLVDLRNHGNSPHSDAFNYDVMADDIRELIEDERLSNVHLLGHSMGGKVAMNIACNYPDLVNKLIVVDIAPRHYPPHHQQIFAGFRSVNLEALQSRAEAENQMKLTIPNPGVRQFILKNLNRNRDGSFEWKLNIEAIERAAHEVGHELAGDACFNQPTLFIRGEKSDYILDTDFDSIHRIFPQSTIVSIPEAGHWVHAEKPNELMKNVVSFLT